MRTYNVYMTILAVLGGIVVAYVILHMQYNPSFLLADVLQVVGEKEFSGIQYRVQTGELSVFASNIKTNKPITIHVSYNPERVSIHTENIKTKHIIQNITVETGNIIIKIQQQSLANELFSLPFTSDAEYHILVSAAFIEENTPVAIQRQGFVTHDI